MAPPLAKQALFLPRIYPPKAAEVCACHLDLQICNNPRAAFVIYTLTPRDTKGRRELFAPSARDSTLQRRSGCLTVQGAMARRSRRVNRGSDSRSGGNAAAEGEGGDGQLDRCAPAAGDAYLFEDLDRYCLEDVPRLRGIIETRWHITTQGVTGNRKSGNRSGGLEGLETGADDGSDEEFHPVCRGATSTTRPKKRAKTNPTRAHIGWWPGIVLKLFFDEVDRGSVRGVVQYTTTHEKHGIFPGAGPEYFDGDVFDVRFVDRSANVDREPTVLHLGQDSGGAAKPTIWRHFPVSSDVSERLDPRETDSVDRHVWPEITSLKKSLAELQAILRRQQQALPPPLPRPIAAQSPPEAWKRLRQNGLYKLISTFTRAKVPHKIRSTVDKDLGDVSGLGAVKSTSFDVKEAFQVTQLEFAELTTWLSRTAPGLEKAHVAVSYPERVEFPLYGESCRVRFETYGDFCNALDVPSQHRYVFLWDSFMSVKGQVCVVGSQKVFDSDLATPETERANAHVRSRVILLGRSCTLSPRSVQNDDGEDSFIPVLRQTGIEVDREQEDSRSPFTDDSGMTAASFRHELSRASPVEFASSDEDVCFDVIWKPLPAVEGIPWDRKEALGSVMFRIPVVCVRTTTLVDSARKLVGDSVENYAGESDTDRAERLDRALQLRRMACHPPRRLSH